MYEKKMFARYLPRKAESKLTYRETEAESSEETHHRSQS